MNNGSVAPLAILLDLKLLGLLFFVDGRRVIAPLALRAGKSNDISHS